MSDDNLYKRGEIWWMRATIDGKEYRESLRTGDVRSARRLKDARIKALKESAHHGNVAIKWKDAVLDYLSHIKGQISAATLQRYAVSFKACEGYFAPNLIGAIDGKIINAFVKARLKDGAAHATVRRDLTAISRVLVYAEAQEWREGNPTLTKRKLLSERRDPIQLPEHEDIERMIAASSRRFGAMIRAAWLTGCRQDELVNVEWRGFNERAKKLDVTGKGNKRRTLELSDAATAHFSAQPITLGSDLIFCRESGDPFAQAASDFCHFRREVEKSAKAEGFDFRRFRFHDLRHLFAVEALRAGKSIYDLSKHLGHTSIGTTEIYTEFLTPEERRRAEQGTAQNTTQPRRFVDDGKPGAPRVD